MDVRTELGETPVSLAAEAGRADLLELFAKAGATLDRREGARVIQKAIMGRRYMVIEELPKLGVDINGTIFQGYTPLIDAIAMTNDPQAVKALIAAGADVNAPMLEPLAKVTPLLVAARYRNADVVRELIAAGAKVDVRDKNGKTPLDLAREAKNDAVEKVLMEANPGK